MGRSKRKRSSGYSIMAEIKKEERAQKRELKNERRRNAKKNNMEKKYLVGFYGDYRKGTKEFNEICKAGMNTKFIGMYHTEPEYSLYQIKGAGESALIKKGNTSVLIEVYEVTESTLETLDLVLGFNNLRPDHSYYIRNEVKSPFGDINIYFWNEEIETSDILISDGDWLDFITNFNKSSMEKIMDKKVDNYLANANLTNAYGTATIEIEPEDIAKEFMDN